MTEEEYLKERVDDQISWYGKKSAINKRYHLWANISIIVFAALIPLFSGLTNIIPWFIYPIAALGVMTAIVTGLSSLYKFQEKWTTYRITAEALQREKLLYKTSASPYDKNGASFNSFVHNVERIMNNENSSWNEIMNRKDGEPAGDSPGEPA